MKFSFPHTRSALLVLLVATFAFSASAADPAPSTSATFGQRIVAELMKKLDRVQPRFAVTYDSSSPRLFGLERFHADFTTSLASKVEAVVDEKVGETSGKLTFGEAGTLIRLVAKSDPSDPNQILLTLSFLTKDHQPSKLPIKFQYFKQEGYDFELDSIGAKIKVTQSVSPATGAIEAKSTNDKWKISFNGSAKLKEFLISTDPNAKEPMEFVDVANDFFYEFDPATNLPKVKFSISNTSFK